MSVQTVSHGTADNHAARTPLLTVDDVSKRLAMSRSTIWRLADAGRLPRLRIGPGGRSVRFREADVDRLVQQAAEPPTSESPDTTPDSRERFGDDRADNT